jgi:hypothetical protein
VRFEDLGGAAEVGGCFEFAGRVDDVGAAVAVDFGWRAMARRIASGSSTSLTSTSVTLMPKGW